MSLINGRFGVKVTYEQGNKHHETCFFNTYVIGIPWVVHLYVEIIHEL